MAMVISDLLRARSLQNGGLIMRTLDAQVHAYERNHPGRPWVHPHPPGLAEVTGRQLAAAMDEAGVDGAILVSPFTIYGCDTSYAVGVRQQFPDKFRLVMPIDITAANVEGSIAQWAATDGAVGVRLLLMGDAPTDPEDPRLNCVLRAAARHSIPVNVQCWGRLEQFRILAARNPETVMLVDHLGLPQTLKPPPPPEPFADLPKLLALASLDNVAVKITGACTLSREPFPYRDIWDPLFRIFDAFGLDRCLWGTDWTRTTGHLTYAQAADAFRVSERLPDSDRAALMGGTLARIYGWPA
jgi:predicted TIM-barrel fold metal-dependent hydrolase